MFYECYLYFDHSPAYGCPLSLANTEQRATFTSAILNSGENDVIIFAFAANTVNNAARDSG